MSQRLFWLNIGLFILIPMAIFFLFLPARPGQQAKHQALEAVRLSGQAEQPAGKAEDREISGGTGKIMAGSAGWETKLLLSPGDQEYNYNQLSGFLADLAVTGAIGYFNGQANLQGQVFPDQPHRFMAQEQIRIDMYFSAEPREITVTINDIQRRLAGIPGRRYYWTSFILPEWPSTLDWDGTRLADPYLLQVTAIGRSDPAMTAAALIEDIEITGNVMSRVHVQPN